MSAGTSNSKFHKLQLTTFPGIPRQKHFFHLVARQCESPGQTVNLLVNLQIHDKGSEMALV